MRVGARNPRVLWPLFGLVVAFSTFACGGAEPGMESGAERGTAETATAGAQEADAPQRFDITTLGYNEGNPDAPIRVVEFSDFGCPHCQEFHENSYPTVHEEFVEGGDVFWKYIPYVLGTFPNSVQAARAGECAIVQDAFPAMRDRLFAEQVSWMNSDDPVGLFVQYAEEEGLDGEQLGTCVREGLRDEQLQRNIEVGRQIGIRGTPSFIIQGDLVQGNRPPEFFRQVFPRILEEMGESDAAN